MDGSEQGKDGVSFMSPEVRDWKLGDPVRGWGGTLGRRGWRDGCE